jgi:hypothetical protein
VRGAAPALGDPRLLASALLLSRVRPEAAAAAAAAAAGSGVDEDEAPRCRAARPTLARAGESLSAAETRAAAAPLVVPGSSGNALASRASRTLARASGRRRPRGSALGEGLSSQAAAGLDASEPPASPAPRRRLVTAACSAGLESAAAAAAAITGPGAAAAGHGPRPGQGPLLARALVDLIVAWTMLATRRSLTSAGEAPAAAAVSAPRSSVGAPPAACGPAPAGAWAAPDHGRHCCCCFCFCCCCAGGGAGEAVWPWIAACCGPTPDCVPAAAPIWLTASPAPAAAPQPGITTRRTSSSCGCCPGCWPSWW